VQPQSSLILCQKRPLHYESTSSYMLGHLSQLGPPRTQSWSEEYNQYTGTTDDWSKQAEAPRITANRLKRRNQGQHLTAQIDNLKWYAFAEDLKLHPMMGPPSRELSSSRKRRRHASWRMQNPHNNHFLQIWRVLYDLQFWHLCAIKWKCTSDIAPQSLHNMRTYKEIKSN